MTREELIERICPTDNIDDCCYIGRDCDKCCEILNAYLDEYDKHIRKNVINTMR